MKTCIIVLGMHRSGTSSLAGILNVSGIFMGKELLKESSDNPKGFFENKKITLFNESLLSQIGTSWHDIYPIEINQILGKEDLKKRATAILDEDYGDKDIFGIKDPRMCILFPFWKEVLEEMGVKIKVLFIYRNPLEVAYSLLYRDCFSFGKGILLWAKYNLYGEYYTRGCDREFILFDDLLNHPFDEMRKIQERMGLSFDENKITDFLEKELKKFNLPPFPENTPEFIKDIFSLMKKPDNKEKEFDLLRKEYENTVYDILEELIGDKNAKAIISWKIEGKEERCYLSIEPVKRWQEIYFEFKDPSSPLINLLHRPCIIEFERFSLNRDSEEIDISDNLFSNAIFKKEKTYFFLSAPCIDLSRDQIRSIKIRFRYLEVGEKIFPAIQKEFLNLLYEKRMLVYEKRMLEGEKKLLEEELRNIYASKSWRFTKPLRDLKRLLSFK